MANKKINVAKYAEQYGITLKQAHVEIQNWLFEQGCVWYRQLQQAPMYLFAASLLVDNDKGISSVCADSNYFEQHKSKEITLSRKIVLTPSAVQDTIEFEGKTYNKDAFLKAIGQLEEVVK